MSPSLPTQTEIAVDTLLAALEDQSTSVRDGTDPMVLLYWWKQRNPDTGLFMRALEDLDRDGLVTIGPAPGRRLRLSTHGFAWLDARLPVDHDADTGPATGADAGAGAEPDEAEAESETAPTRLAAPAPLPERIAALVRIFSTLDLPLGRGIEAGALLRIWLLDGRPGAELRETLDAMAADKTLTIERGAQTVFVL